MTSEPALRHIPEETLEQYCMGRLSESESEPVEEHLLLCNQCQDALTETEQFISAVRAATEQLGLQPARQPWWNRLWGSVTSLPKPVWAIAACALALFVVIPNRGPSPAVVELQTMRGPETAVQAPANTFLSLRLSLSGIDASGPLELRVADASGQVIRQAAVQTTDGQTVAGVDGLSPGAYWARLYSDGKMVREYALTVR
jgi:anti-sigma factor RsiW